jgi:Fic family protein
MYIYDHKTWPQFSWDAGSLMELLAEVRHAQGRLTGRMDGLGFPLRQDATLQTLTQDVIKTSEIEGEKLDAAQVRSSLARRMGLEIGALLPVDRNVEGIAEVMIDATRRYQAPLTQERLFGWHAALFPTGRNGLQRITVGRWRTAASGPMQIVSGPYGREQVHYEAPGHDRLKNEMRLFLAYFNAVPETDLVIKSAIAHFWFVTIHPFDDGNGRIARALADSALARSEKSPQRFYSMSAQIRSERKAYYEVLERCQKGPLDITPWIEWYLRCLQRAIAGSEKMLAAVLEKSRFWKVHAGESFNARQRDLLNRLLAGFEGKLTSSKWAKITRCSQDTALRDIADLSQRNILARTDAGGRSTNYVLRLPE